MRRNTYKQPTKIMDSLESSIQAKLDADTEFQTSISTLSDEEKTAKISEKKQELLSQEITSLREKAERAEKAEELAKNYKSRAEKAEADKKDGKKAGEPNTPNLSLKDSYALLNSRVHEDDVEEVVKAAKLLDKPVHEALKEPLVQSLLKTRQEYRDSAKAANTKPARPGTKKVSDEELLRDASKGIVPEKGTPEALQLWKARRGIK